MIGRRRRKNPGSGDMLAIAAGGAALIYFWPQLSALFNGSSADTSTGSDAQVISITQAPTTDTRLTIQATTRPVATTTTATPTPTPASGATGSPCVINGQAGLTNTDGSCSLIYAGLTCPNGICSTTPTGNGPTIRTALSGAGRRRLRGVVSPQAQRAAALVVAHLNNSVTYDAPQVTNNSPIGPWTPGAVQLPGGCWQYGNTPVLMNCPAGATPAAPGDEPFGKCLPGYTMSVTGQCAKTDDQVQLAQLNSTPYAGGSAVLNPDISSTILGFYASTTGVKPGSMLAAALGLPANQAYGTFAQASDGFNYLMLDQIFIRQGTATQLTRPTGPIGPRPGPLPAGKLGSVVPSAVPITNATLIAASSDPTIAGILGNDPRGMLTVDQWNYFYTQSTGVLQVAPPYPHVDPSALMSAKQYQAWRQQAGLSPTQKQKLGLILNARPGAFPLGGISDGPARTPFIHPGNHNIYRVPGRGVVRMGTIHAGGGDHRWQRSPFPRAAGWRHAE